MNNLSVSSINQQDAFEKLELFFSCRNLDDLDFITVTDSFLVVKLEEPNKPQKLILRTKVYDNSLNPDYAETVTIDYFFEIRQKLRFQVYHEDSPPKLVGTAESTIGQIFGSPDNGLSKQLLDRKGKKSGNILVRCEKVASTTNNIIQFKLQCAGLPSFFTFLCFCSTCDSFYRIIRLRQNDQLLIYESQVQFGTSHPVFNHCKLSERRLCKNTADSKFQIRLFAYAVNGAHKQIGRSQVNLNVILDPRMTPLLDSKRIEKGQIAFKNVKKSLKVSFIDYMQAGLQLMLITCIDFTASNGSPTSPSSLHYVLPNKKSPYEQALEEVSTILLDYDYDKLVPVYGFGAKCKMPSFNSHNQTHHCFPLNGNDQNAHVYMVEGIMKAYRNALQQIQFSGPTYFNVLLQSAIDECYQIQKQINQYIIVFILTDGEIHDTSKVIDQIIQCCTLPISLIIVGIGNGPFDIMEKLDDDNCQLTDSKGRKTTRDLVQFVQFREFRNNGVELAKEVLEELPRQVEEYYQLMGIGPDILQKKKSPPPPPNQLFNPMPPHNFNLPPPNIHQNKTFDRNPYYNPPQ